MMVLADTSVWIDHFRRGDQQLARFLDLGEVVMHPFVIGELALGTTSRIASLMDDLHDLPKAKAANNDPDFSEKIRENRPGFEGVK